MKSLFKGFQCPPPKRCSNKQNSSAKLLNDKFDMASNLESNSKPGHSYSCTSFEDPSLNNEFIPYMNLLRHVENFSQLPPILMEVIRRVYPKSQSISIHERNWLTSKRLGKIQKLFGVAQKSFLRTKSTTDIKKRFSSALELRTKQFFGRWDRSTKNEQTTVERTAVLWVDCSHIVKPIGQIQDNELREMFRINSSADANLKLVAILVTTKTSEINGLLISFCLEDFEASEEKALLNLERELTLSIERIQRERYPLVEGMSVLPAVNNLPAIDYTSPVHIVPTSLSLTKVLHLLSKNLAESFDAELGFVLFKEENDEQWFCCATSEEVFKNTAVIELSSTALRSVTKKNKIYLMDEFEVTQLQDFVGFINQHSENRSRKSCSNFFCCTLKLTKTDEPSQENGSPLQDSSAVLKQLGNLYPDSDKLEVLVCVLNSNYYEQTSQLIQNKAAWSNLIHEVHVKLSAVITVHVCAIQMAYGQMQLTFQAEFSQLLLLQLQLTQTNLKFESTTCDTLFKKLIRRLPFASCQIFLCYKRQTSWQTKLYNYTIDSQSEMKKGKSFFEQVQVLRDGEVDRYSLVESIARWNRAYPDNFILPVWPNGNSFFAIIQLNTMCKSPACLGKNKSIIQDMLQNFFATAFYQINLMRKITETRHSLDLIDELLNYHVKSSNEELNTFMKDTQYLAFTPPSDFEKFSFLARGLESDASVKAVLHMFHRLGFVDQLHIRSDTLVRFVLTVRRNYRTPAYHNWQHAFSVGHFSFLCLVNAAGRLRNYLDSMEMLTLFVGALCHDIDHRGLNNHYQSLSNSTMAALYGTNGSILEHHHLGHTMRILRNAECDILANLSSKEREQAERLIKEVILATDLVQHLKIFPRIKEMSLSGYNPKTAEHHHLLLSLLVTTSDLSDQCKSWRNTRVAASLIYDEFFKQGDLERKMGVEPAVPMNRDKAYIPELQISFLDSVVIPCFDALRRVLHECEPAFKAIERNRRVWSQLTQAIQAGQFESYSTVDLLKGHYDNYVQNFFSQAETHS